MQLLFSAKNLVKMFGYFLIVASHFLVYYGSAANAMSLGFKSVDLSIVVLGISSLVSFATTAKYAPILKRRKTMIVIFAMVLFFAGVILASKIVYHSTYPDAVKLVEGILGTGMIYFLVNISFGVLY